VTRIGWRGITIRARNKPGIKGAWNMESYTVDNGAQGKFPTLQWIDRVETID
jgi:hypothetical protein